MTLSQKKEMQQDSALIQNYQKAEEELTRVRMAIAGKKGGLSQQALEELTCSVDRKKCFGFTSPQKNIPEADLTHLTEDKSAAIVATTFCASSKRVEVGSGPDFKMGKVNGNCCVKVVAPQGVSQLGTHVKSWIGAKYLKKHIQECVNSGRGPLTYCIQRFNGTGCFGCTESSSNDCFNGLVMEDRPVYGARAADLMLNSFMNEPQIREMVSEASAQMRKPVVSIFCYGHDQARFMVPRDQFRDEQNGYLLGGTQHLYKMKFELEHSLRVPKTDEEKRLYISREKNRAIACKSLLNNK